MVVGSTFKLAAASLEHASAHTLLGSDDDSDMNEPPTVEFGRD
jgi:hypothetical protein